MWYMVRDNFRFKGHRGKTVTDEILLIVLAGAWLFVHVIAHGLTQWAAAGNTWAFGARDDLPRETLLSGRLRRAFANYLETSRDIGNGQALYKEHCASRAKAEASSQVSGIDHCTRKVKALHMACPSPERPRHSIR